MIEEILTDHPEHKASAPTGELLKFGVQALLSTRPFHNQLGKRGDCEKKIEWVKQSVSASGFFCVKMSGMELI